MSTATANPYGGTSIQMPMDLIRLSIDQRVYVKLKGERELRGKLYVRYLFLIVRSPSNAIGER